jgi:hypothetical protein
MPIARILPLLSTALLLGTLAAGAARAQPLVPPFLEYAAKFTCGTESLDEPDDVVAGVYASSINIHNPQAKTTVVFVKKIVVALREGATPRQPIIVPRGILRPDQADRVDCRFIKAQLKLPALAYVEGFVVLEVPLTSTSPQPVVLDVVGKYTARPATGGVSTQSVVPVPGAKITN